MVWLDKLVKEVGYDLTTDQMREYIRETLKTSVCLLFIFCELKKKKIIVILLGCVEPVEKTNIILIRNLQG